MRSETTVWAGEVPSFGFRDLTATTRARRGSPALVGELHGDAGDLGLVLERRDQLADAPVGNGEILSCARLNLEQSARISDDERRNAVVDGVLDHSFAASWRAWERRLR